MSEEGTEGANPQPSRNLRIAVETAQSVTEGITDPQLRGIAFGKVLDHLLAGSVISRTAQHPSLGKPSPKQRGRAVRVSNEGPTDWVGTLQREGFFSSPKSLGDVTEAVRAQGHNVESKNVTEPLEKLVRLKLLRRERRPSGAQKRGRWMYSIY